MYTIFRSIERGGGDFGWLKTKYSFSFSNWYNPKRIGFGNLLVLNDDIIMAGTGFGFHPHDNMEIITIMLKGELTHKDSMGNIKVLEENYIQHMSAGIGIVHSEMNFGKDEVHLLQLWILPKKKNVKPIYQEKKIDYNLGETKLVSKDGDNNTLKINQECEISILQGESKLKINLKKSKLFMFVIDGNLEIFKEKLNIGDSIEVEDEINLDLKYEGKILLIKL